MSDWFRGPCRDNLEGDSLAQLQYRVCLWATFVSAALVAASAPVRCNVDRTLNDPVGINSASADTGGKIDESIVDPEK